MTTWTDYIALDEVIEILSRHKAYAEEKVRFSFPSPSFVRLMR